ncbi:MAG: DALR anticodon-binding domain-containing protein, partial [Eubacteriales bacterium]|nr:DALR anticodon-binding domain-containing protein [Eubacteriales bacterium]
MRLLEQDGISLPNIENVNLDLLSTDEEVQLAVKLARYPDEVKAAAELLEPSRLTHYVLDVASQFHSFYNVCRVKGEETELMNARIILVECTRQVIRNVLGILSISAPERM